MLVRILIDGMAKMMNGLRLNKHIKAFFHWRKGIKYEDFKSNGFDK